MKEENTDRQHLLIDIVSSMVKEEFSGPEANSEENTDKVLTLTDVLKLTEDLSFNGLEANSEENTKKPFILTDILNSTIEEELSPSGREVKISGENSNMPVVKGKIIKDEADHERFAKKVFYTKLCRVYTYS